MERFEEVIESPSASEWQKAHAINSRGWQRFRKMQCLEAIVDFRQAIDLDDHHVNARGNLAIALLVNGQTDEAMTVFEQALEMADVEQVDDMQKDLDDALREHASIVGAAEIQQRIAARRAELSSSDETD